MNMKLVTAIELGTSAPPAERSEASAAGFALAQHIEPILRKLVAQHCEANPDLDPRAVELEVVATIIQTLAMHRIELPEVVSISHEMHGLQPDRE